MTGKLHLKLLRPDVDVGSIATLPETNLREAPQVERGSWLNTINELKISYSRRTVQNYILEPGDVYDNAWYPPTTPSLVDDESANYGDERIYGRFNGYADSNCSIIRFPNVPIPQGTTITNAYLKLFDYHHIGDGPLDLSEYEDPISTGVYVYSLPDIEDLPVTANLISLQAYEDPVEWENIGIWVVHQWYESPDITTQIQTLIDNSTWEAGKALMIMLRGTQTSGAAENRYFSLLSSVDVDFDANPTWAEAQSPQLVIGTDETIGD